MKNIGKCYLILLLAHVGLVKANQESSKVGGAMGRRVGNTPLNEMTGGNLPLPPTLSLDPPRELKRKNIFSSKMSGTMMGIMMMMKKYKKTVSNKMRHKMDPKRMRKTQPSMKKKQKYYFKGKSKKYQMPASRPAPRKSVPNLPPWFRQPGDRSPPVPSPTGRSRNQLPTVVSTNLVLGTAGDPKVDFVVIEQGLRTSVDLSVPDQVDQIYLVRDRDVEPGSACPPAGGIAISVRDRSFVTVPLYSKDSVIVFCVGGSVVSQSYYMFESMVGMGGNNGGTEFPNSFVESVDFSSATAASPATVSFPFGPGVDLNGVGTVVFYNARSGTSGGFERRLNVDSYYVAPDGESVHSGEACPIPLSEFLPPDEKFPLTLFVLEGTEDQTVYACSGDTIVGIANFLYITDNVDVPSPSPTIRTLAPSLFPPEGSGFTLAPSTPMPTLKPTDIPSLSPSQRPSSSVPTARTEIPSKFSWPSQSPSIMLSDNPTGTLSDFPTMEDVVSDAPSDPAISSVTPSISPTAIVSGAPSMPNAQSESPSSLSGRPSVSPTTALSGVPSMPNAQSESPSSLSGSPSVFPTTAVSGVPSLPNAQSESPSSLSGSASALPSSLPSTFQSNSPTISDAAQSESPSAESENPSESPSSLPSTFESNAPSVPRVPSESPSAVSETVSDSPTGPNVGIVYGLQPNCAIIDDTRFNICLDISSASGEIEEWFPLMAEAADRWERLISSDPWGPWDPSSFDSLNSAFVATQKPANTIDDIYVSVLVGPIDGGGGRFAEAGPDLFNTLDDGTREILAASIKIDEADLQNVLKNGIFKDLMLHELGHVLGLGSLWRNGVHTSGAEYIGEKGVLAWRDIGCVGPLPFVSLGDRSHWNEDCLKNEGECRSDVNFGNTAALFRTQI
eukprot:scaffold2235_cov167-Amphora_coffeaeformis.AAC.5